MTWRDNLAMRGAGWITAMLLLVGCVEPTALRVRVSTDLDVPGELQRIHLTVGPGDIDAGVLGGDGGVGFDELIELDPAIDPSAPLFGGAQDLVLGVVPHEAFGPADGRPIVVRVEPTTSVVDGEVCVIDAMTRVRPFVAGQVISFTIPITSDCCNVHCESGFTCVRGVCLPPDGSCTGATTDETVECGQGVCRRSVPLCVQGLLSECIPGPRELDRCGASGLVIDADCNGLPDTGARVQQYRDTDADGFGVDERSVEACGLLAGFSALGGDCDDDASPDVHPGAAEVCNGVDEDCDALIDEGVLITFFRDGDGDGFGAPGSPIQACSAPAGFVSDSRDCDDSSPAVRPGAPEACNQRDDNCNGAVDDGAPDCGFGVNVASFAVESNTTVSVTVPEPGFSSVVPLVLFDSYLGDQDTGFRTSVTDTGSSWRFDITRDCDGRAVTGRAVLLGVGTDGGLAGTGTMTVRDGQSGLGLGTFTPSRPGASDPIAFASVVTYDTCPDDDTSFEVVGSAGASSGSFSGSVWSGGGTQRMQAMGFVLRPPPRMRFARGSLYLGDDGATSTTLRGVISGRWIALTSVVRYDNRGGDTHDWVVGCRAVGADVVCDLNAFGDNTETRVDVLVLSGF